MHAILRRPLRTLLAAAFLSVLASSTVAAQSAIVIVREAPVSAAELDRARSAAIEVLAERGIRLVRAPDGETCERADCAAVLAERAGADLVVLVEPEPAEGGLRVRARLVAPGASPTEAVATVSDAGVAAATAAALEEAFATRSERRSGFLMVRTRPRGARVTVDGRPIGETPVRRMVRAGQHEVRIVPPDGGEPVARRVTVRALEETSIDLRLGETGDEDAPAASQAPARAEPSPLNWLVGGGLVLAGVVALVSPLQTLATDGQCVDELENVGCLERVQFGLQSGILMGLGLAALTAAVIVDLVAPIRVAVQAGPARAGVLLEGRF